MAEANGAPKRRNGAPKRRPGGRPFLPGNKQGRKFQKGGPPGPGRPPLPPGFREALEALEPHALAAIADIVHNPDHKDRRQASEYVLNQRHGKPTERTEISGPGGSPLVPRGPSEVVEALRKLVDPAAPAPADPPKAE